MMRKLAYVLAGTAAFAAASVAVSQTAPRPAPTVSAPNLQVANGPTNAQLSAKIDQLSSDLAAANKKIAALESAQKTIATKGFENAGKLSELDKQFQGHNHYQIYLQDEKDGAVMNTKIKIAPTSIPSFHCKLKPNAPVTGSIASRYDCAVTN